MLDEIHTTFRDPAGSLLKYNSKIFRFINPLYEKEFNELQILKSLKKLLENNDLSKYRILKENEISSLLKDQNLLKIFNRFNSNIVLQHEVMDFVNYPYEWSNNMLFDAAKLTLHLFENMLLETYGLKDATPFNIIFENTKPVFVDLLSFEKRDPFDPIWLGLSQFTKTFLLPLYMNNFAKTSISKSFLSNLDGLNLQDCLIKTSFFNSLSYSLIKIPNFLSKFTKAKHYKPQRVKNKEFARFILSKLIKKLKKRLNSLKPRINKSTWSNYMADQTHYKKSDFSIKEKFIKKILTDAKPKKVLDIGSNTGHFSILAAQTGAKVISLDNDPMVIDLLYLKAKTNNLNILPMVVNISRPTPSFGWKNKEYSSFIQRATKSVDLVFMLALIHHMQVSDQIPLFEIASIAALVTRDGLIIEYIDPKDPMFKKIVRGREYLYSDLNIENFKKTFENYFSILDEQIINETRSIFYMRKKKDL
ncbi:MAG: hypothetical protein K1060chlam3_00516 [Candidatus Anoxychlamydiales bacterium]|nr:hypothetical protein [Candidatus Anoxychlamydiales bacterium]